MTAQVTAAQEPPEPAGLDLWAARRQSSGHSVNKTELRRLLARQLQLSPHPVWELPTSPTWQEDPFHDRNWCFQYHSLRWLEPLRRAGAARNEAALRMWLHYARSWVAKNQRGAAASEWAWTDMVDGLRAQQLCLAAPLVWRRAGKHLAWLEDAIRDHAEHLADPRHMGHANHALHQQESLFICGRVLKEEKYWKLASRRMERLLREQYDDQGMNAEGATAYHHNNFIWWEKALSRFDLEQLPRPAGADRHENAPVTIAHATRPDGTLVSIGDTDVLRPRKADTPLTDYVTSDGAEGEPPAQTVAVYDAGYVFARSGWGDERRAYADQTYYTLRFGPARRVHGHADGASITYSADRVNWIVDPGKYQYGSSIPRDHFVSRAAHSVLSLDGRRPFRDAYVDLARSTFTDTHHDLVLEDLSFESVRLTRRVIFSTALEYLVVIDDAAGDRNLSGVQRWQLGADVEAAVGTDHVDLSCAGAKATLWFDGDVELDSVREQQEPFDGFVSVGWKQLAPATAVLARQKGRKLRFATVLASDRTLAPRIARLPDAEPGTLALVVETTRGREEMRISADHVAIRPAS